MSLDTYRKKRDFRKTPEPTGGKASADALRFVIQKHDASHLHYDFRLELDGVLKSWAVPKGPVPDPSVKRLAMQVEDHPIDYGDFEGTIPKGEYGGGTVMLWDRGTWEPIGDPHKGLRKGRLDFELHGEKLNGRWTMVRSGGEPDKPKWLLFKRTDEHARDDGDALLEEASRSVATGRSLAEIAGADDRVWSGRKKGGGRKAAKQKPRLDASDVEGTKSTKSMPKAKAQLATLVDAAPDGEDWLHEIKFDGYRLLVRIEGGKAQLLTRNDKDWTDRFPRIARALSALPAEGALIDGEAVILDEAGRSDFQALQNAQGESGRTDMFFFAFDLLWLNGVDLRRAPQLERKEMLRQVVEAAPAVVRYSDHVVGNGPAFHAQACETGLEGIISKRADAPYTGGRGKSWLKVKCLQRQEFVVIGWTEPEGSRTGLGSLVLAVHDGDGGNRGNRGNGGGRPPLRYAGRVGTGFTQETLRDLAERLEPLARKTPPVEGAPKSARGRRVHWVEPELVAEVEFTEWTGDGVVRHPSFKGLREDKREEEVVREEPRGTPDLESLEEVRGVRVTSPTKVLWPEMGVTKGELLVYWDAVADHALPWLRDRPLTLLRCPAGIEKQCFFQKHGGEGMPDVVPRVEIEEKDGEEPYMYIDSPAALIALVQMGVLEIHVWNSRVDRLERPDTMVIDVDPGPKVPWSDVVDAARLIRGMLQELGLESWPRSTGGKGLHVVVPITRRNSWDDVRAFTEAIARRMAEVAPDRFVAKASKSVREGRIYVDYLRNVRNATAIATLSPRAREGAPVALPLTWAQVDDLDAPPDETVRDVAAVLARLEAQPWADFGKARQSITADMKRALGID